MPRLCVAEISCQRVGSIASDGKVAFWWDRLRCAKLLGDQPRSCDQVLLHPLRPTFRGAGLFLQGPLEPLIAYLELVYDWLSLRENGGTRPGPHGSPWIPEAQEASEFPGSLAARSRKARAAGYGRFWGTRAETPKGAALPALFWGAVCMNQQH